MGTWQILVTLFMVTGIPGHADGYKAQYKPTSDYAAMDDTEQAEFDNTMNGLVNQICLAHGQVTIAERNLAHHKEVTKATGTVNLTAVNNSGSTLVTYKKQRDGGLALYEKLLGKKYDLKDCDL